MRWTIPGIGLFIIMWGSMSLLYGLIERSDSPLAGMGSVLSESKDSIPPDTFEEIDRAYKDARAEEWRWYRKSRDEVYKSNLILLITGLVVSAIGFIPAHKSVDSQIIIAASNK
jgi:hypothetical protein